MDELANTLNSLPDEAVRARAVAAVGPRAPWVSQVGRGQGAMSRGLGTSDPFRVSLRPVIHTLQPEASYLSSVTAGFVLLTI